MPIAFGLGKTKTAPPQKQKFSLPAREPQTLQKSSKSHLHDNSDEEDEEEPRHESVTGFSSAGALLNRPVQEKSERIVNNAGNADWRRRGRGRNLLPAEVQAQKTAEKDGDVVMLERNEISLVSGLQYADKTESKQEPVQQDVNGSKSSNEAQPEKALTEDEMALQALLGNGTEKPKSTVTIAQLENKQLSARDEIDDFQSDFASRPESSTLEGYAAMPIEEFGLAMLRGMGQKRRANGEIIDLDGDKKDERASKVRKQEGFLGIGAKAVPGLDRELGAWGKADMRKNQKGEGFFTPLMRENNATGERITEEEFQKRLKASKKDSDADGWRARRDKNLEQSGRDRNHDDRHSDRSRTRNGHSTSIDRTTDKSRSDSSRRERERERERKDSDYDASRSRRTNDEQRDHDSSSSRLKRERSRSRDRRRERDRDGDHHSDRHRDRHRNRPRDDDNYDSSSSRRSGHRDRDRDSDSRSHNDRR